MYYYILYIYILYSNNRLLLRLDIPVQIEMRDRSIQEGPEPYYNEYMFVVHCIIYCVPTAIYFPVSLADNRLFVKSRILRYIM